MIDRLHILRTLVHDGQPHQSLAAAPPEALVVSTASGDAQTVIALEVAFEALRRMSSREEVRAKLGRDQGFRLEDLEVLVAAVPSGAEAFARTWLERRLPRTARLELERRQGTGVALAGTILGRAGGAPTRERYARGPDGRVRVEAFELHVAEHCNLRCANCCNMSPLVPKHLLTVAEVEQMCAALAPSLVADVVKIMGGEPTLHPELPAILRALRAAGIGDRVRLFTNGLRLASMPEAFWAELEDLTISNYASAPVKPALLALAREKSRQYGFVLNVKPVTEFSQVLSPRFEPDDAVTQRTFSRCWLRHRCLILRRGRFFMCTRSAYADEFLAHVAHDEVPAGVTLDRSQDGIAVDGPDLAARLEAYLNRAQPLGACRYCLGGDGPMEAHHQLTREDVRRGLLSASFRSAP